MNSTTLQAVGDISINIFQLQGGAQLDFHPFVLLVKVNELIYMTKAVR